MVEIKTIVKTAGKIIILNLNFKFFNIVTKIIQFLLKSKKIILIFIILIFRYKIVIFDK